MVTPFVGVWIETYDGYEILSRAGVTPFVGVWIETFSNLLYASITLSHPSWVCGLKLSQTDLRRCVQPVTPFVGVWIETAK